MCISCHVFAAMIPWHISSTLWLNVLFLLTLLISLVYHLCRIQLLLPDSVLVLELDGEECRALFRNPDLNAQLHGEAWCSPLIQILYFNIDNSHTQQGENKKRPLTEAIVRIIPGRQIALIISADSCAAEEQRQLRKFLRWRVVC